MTEERSLTGVEGNGVVPEVEISLRERFFNIKTLLSFVAAFAVLFIVISRLDVNLGTLWLNIKGSNPFLYMLAAAIYYSAFPLRGSRWQLLLRNVKLLHRPGMQLPSRRGLTEIIFLSWFANCILPAKLGDVYRGYLLKRNSNIGLSTGMGTVLAERALDMVMVVVLMVLAGLTLWGGNESLTWGIAGVGLAMALVALVGVVVMHRFGSSLQRLLPFRFQGYYQAFQEGTLGSFGQLPILIALSAVIWLVEAGRLYFVTQSLGVPLGLPVVLFVASANSILTIFPFTPAGLGLVEVGVTGLLMLFTSKELALAVTIMDRGISYWSVLLLGLVTFLVSRKK